MENKTNSKSVGIIGGDERIKILTEIIQSKGFSVMRSYKSVSELFSLCDIIILPIPVTRDKVTVFSKESEQEVRLDDIISCAKKCQSKVFLGGIIPRPFKLELESWGHTVIDFFEDEELILRNALATAEGALMLAMEKTDTTVLDNEFAVLGFGRIGAYLAKILTSLGGIVTVFARSDIALLSARELGYKTHKLNESCTDTQSKDLAIRLDSVKVIFNTVPSIIITRKIIEKMHKRPLYIELASNPYGVDNKDARDLNFNVLYAPSLPGRYSPRSAAEYIFDTISSYLNEI